MSKDKKWMQQVNKEIDKGSLREKAAKEDAIIDSGPNKGNISKAWINDKIKHGSKKTKKEAVLAKNFSKTNH